METETHITKQIILRTLEKQTRKLRIRIKGDELEYPSLESKEEETTI